MSTDNKDRLLELAAAISDDKGVDWADQQNDDISRQLRRIESIAGAFREFRGLAAERESEEDGLSEILFDWGHLKVLEKIGDGSFGEVFRAWDPILDREVALKLRRIGSAGAFEGERHFIAEARRLARLHHANILTIHGADVHDGRVGLWTELVEGRNLEQSLAEDGPFASYEAVLVGLELCRALAAVHGAGLVHGDVKAANVIRDRDGRLVLADLGAATEISVGNEYAGVFLSPLTAAPELLDGEAPSPVSDLYSLGVLMFRLLTDRLPVEAEDLDGLRHAHQRGRCRGLRDHRPDLPRDLVRVVEKAISADPGDRYSDAGSMERDLDAVLLRECTGNETGIPSGTMHNPPWVIVAAALVIIILGLIVVYFGGLGGRRPPPPTRESAFEAPVGFGSGRLGICEPYHRVL